MSVYKGQEKVLNSITAVEEEAMKEIISNELITNKNKYYGTVYEDLNLDDLTVSGFYFARYNLSTGVYSDLNYPCSGYGYVINRVYLNTETNHILQIFVPTGDKVQADLYMRKRAGSGGVWQPWIKCCSTKVADVALTEVSIPDGLFSSKNSVSYIKYEVVNGIAFVYINIREGRFVNSGVSRNITVPKMKSPFNYTITGEDYRCNLSILANGNNMQIWSLGDVAVTTNYGCCISYPVAE